MRIELTPKETACILWGIAEMGDFPKRAIRGPLDPLHLLDLKYTRAQVVAGCLFIENGIQENARFVTEPLSEVEKDILRLCCENSSWLDSYDRVGAPAEARKEAHDAIRTLAYKLETLGIEVNHMPTNRQGT